MPQPRKPNRVKDITGSVKERTSEVDLPPVDHVPEPPEWLPNPEAIAEWRRMAPILMANRLLSAGDLPALANYCALHGRIAEIWGAGLTPPSAIMAQFVSLGNAFGLAPAWRSKVKPLDESQKQNPFAKHKSPATPTH
jgi:phage terminase small subunit